MLALLAWAAIQAPQGPWKLPIPIASVELSPGGHYASLYAGDHEKICILNLATHQCTEVQAQLVRFSADDAYAIYQVPRLVGQYQLLDLKTGKVLTSFDANYAAFSPDGHSIALLKSETPDHIDIYQPATGASRKVVISLNSVLANGATPEKTYVRLDSWSADGMVIALNQNPFLNAGESSFVVDPLSGAIKPDPIPDRLYKGATAHLVDGSDIVLTGLGPNGFGVGLMFDSKLQRMLLSQKDLDPAYTNIQLPLGDLKSNVVLIAATDRTSSKAQLWAVNAVTAKRALIAQEAWPSHKFFTIASALSTDGAWAYVRDPKDDTSLIAIALPKSVAVVNLSQSQKSR